MLSARNPLPVLGVAALALACALRVPVSPGPGAAASTHAASPLPLRALIVGGGPSRELSQAGVESNARYVARLLQNARSSRLLWTDGLSSSATVAAVSADRDGYLARLALAFALNQELPAEAVGFRVPSLPRLDGAVTKVGIRHEVASLGRALRPHEAALLYFTGHGSPGTRPGGAGSLKPRSQRSSAKGDEAGEDDFENTLYWMWNERPLSVRALAPMLQAVPPRNPLVVVMVQCHAGGFGNLMFQNGDPARPLAQRDVCGFFAATSDRLSSGCTPQINEAEAEDFTTHFFGALSNRGRGGRPVLGADFDRDGRASLLEAFAYASLHDRSIDVPTCTSQEFLAHLFPLSQAWYREPYAPLEARAAPWQKALLQGLSRELKLSGEDRLDAAARQARKLSGSTQGGAEGAAWSPGLLQRALVLRRGLERRLPGLKRPPGSPGFARAQREALKYLRAQPESWRGLARDIERESSSLETGEVREAMLWRFVDACFTLIAERRLSQSGTAGQQAAFQRLRASESRSLFAMT